MKSLNSEQRRITAEILGNISVAWFTAGVISPIFIQPESIAKFLFLFLIGLAMSGVFTTFALLSMKRQKK